MSNFTIIGLTLFALFFSASGLFAQSSQPVWETDSNGQLILRPFPHAPYPHESRKDGYKNDIVFPYVGHYDDSTIGIFIPADYHPGDVVNYVVHFHGWHNHVSNVIPFYHLEQQMEQAKINAILIVPQGPKEAADSGGGKLELDPGAFEKLMNEITDFLVAEGKIHTHTIGDITLSTHSGGYKVTAAILDHGGLASHITDVCLLDSSYGNLEWFANWCAASPEHRLISFHTQHLNDANMELRGLLDKAHVPYRTIPDFKLTADSFKPRGVLIVPTLLPHDEVPMGHEYFRRVIQFSEFAE
jgi:hypothetical protein